MSWLFTIVFSGIAFTSNLGSPVNTPVIAPPPAGEVVLPKPDETEKFEQTYPLSANGSIRVSNVNGPIVVEAWDRNEVQLVAVKTADTKEHLADVEIRVDSKPDSFAVESKYDNWKQRGDGDRWRGGKLEVAYHLMVPSGASLKEVETVNGTVTVSNFSVYTKVSAVNGSVRATNLRGTAHLSTVNGEVYAEFTSLDSSSKINLDTVNGKVNLTIPSDANATIKVDTLNGVISNDFGLPVRKGKYVGRDLYGKLGSGDVRIKMDSVNGDLRISHPNDGKTPAQVTNLLPQKEKGDDDWDKDDEDSSVNISKADKAAARAQKDVAKAQRETARATAEALKDARKELESAGPEIAKMTAEAVKASAVVVDSESIKQAVRAGMESEKIIRAGIVDSIYNPSASRVDQKSDAIPVKGTPTVTITAKGCGVKVTGWDRPEVQYTVTQFSDVRSSEPIKSSETHDDSNVTIKVENSSETRRSRIEVFVPKRSNLKIKTDGEIRLDGVTGELELTARDEAINVRDAGGELNVSSADGRIRVIGFQGGIAVRSQDGAVNLEGDFQKLNAASDAGSICLTIAENAGLSLRAESPNVRIDGLQLQLVKSEEGLREFKLGDGSAAFQIKTDGDVQLRAKSVLTASN